MKNKLFFGFSLAALLIANFFQAIGQTVNVTIPNLSAESGSSISVPINVSDVSGMNIFAYNLILTFNQQVLDATGVTIAGTIAQSWGAPTFADANGQISIAGAGASALSGAGALIYVNFSVVGSAGSQTQISFSQMLFNEGEPAANATGGTFSVPGGVSQVSVSIPDTSANAAESVAIPINVSDVTGLNIFSYNFTLTFDQQVLDATGIAISGTLTQPWGSPTFSDGNGQIVIASAGSSALAGSGVLLYINFSVVGSGGSQTTLTFSNFVFNEGNPTANTSGGVFSIAGQVIYRFQVDMSVEKQHVNAGDIIGIRGSLNPLSWSSTLPMSDVDTDNVYIVDVDFTGTPAGTKLEYKFVYHAPPPDNNTNVTWESNPGPTGPYYNREINLTETSQVLPVVYWNNTEPTPTRWSVQSSGVSFMLTSVKAVSKTVAWTCGNDGNIANVLRTIDGGENWTNVWSGSDTIKVQHVDAIDLNSAVVTAFTGSTQDNNTALIFKTPDGGNSWNKAFELPAAWVNHIKMFNEQKGIAIGDPYNGFWLILKTTDGGNSWQQISNPPASTEGAWTSHAYVFWLDNNKGFFGTNTINYYITVDGGENWNVASVPFLPRTNSVAFNHENYGVAFCNQGPLARSTNGGLTWDEIPLPGTGTMRHLVYHENAFWIVQANNIFKSEDDGLTYELQTSAGSVLRYISFVTSKEGTFGWAVGNNGTILKYVSPWTNIKIKEKATVPDFYGLYQNYPNPFNPETTICFFIPKDNLVELTIYNVLGQKIRDLIHHNYPAGEHAVKWDGRDETGNIVNSGIYLINFKAGDFSASRKITFMK